jgi:hypothetical protein
VSRCHRPLFLSLALSLALMSGSAAQAKPVRDIPAREGLETSPAYRYANMSDEAAFAELDQRGVRYERLEAALGVRSPVRLTAPVRGVHVHSAAPESQRAGSYLEVLDARLALALDDFCAILERHDVVELIHFTMYRPNGDKPEPALEQRARKRAATERKGPKREVQRHKSRKPAEGNGNKATRRKGIKSSLLDRGTTGSKAKRGPARKGKQASKSRMRKPNGGAQRGSKQYRTVGWSPPGTRHPAGLAIDVGALRKRDGSWLKIGAHFDGQLGSRTCDPGAPKPTRREARELRAIVCAAARDRLFTYILTPNYDRPHVDHFHMEIRGDVSWFLHQ